MASDSEVVRAYCDAWMRGDTATVAGMYHEELTLEWPGRHRLAGSHIGLQASVDALLDLQAVTNRTPLEIIDVLVGEHRVIVLVRERWTTDPINLESESIELVRALDYTVADGKLRTCRVLESDQHTVDDWIDRHG